MTLDELYKPSTKDGDTELIETLVAISVVSKVLARKLFAQQKNTKGAKTYEQNKRPCGNLY